MINIQQLFKSNKTMKKSKSTNIMKKSKSIPNNKQQQNKKKSLKNNNNKHKEIKEIKKNNNKSPKKKEYYHFELVILPNQLFSPELIIKSIETEILSNLNVNVEYYSIALTIFEHPVYFGDRLRVPNMKFNKKKLVYHRASCKLYFDTFEIPNTHNGTVSLDNKNYIDYTKAKNKNSLYNYFKSRLTHLDKNEYIIYFDPVDHQINKELLSLNTNTKTNETKIFKLENLLFLAKHTELEEFHTKKNKKRSFFHSTFYSWMKNKVDILTNTKSYDTQNRNKMPHKTIIPPLPKNDSNKHKKYILEAIKYVNKVKSNNYGFVNDETDIIFPITRDKSLDWLLDFCKVRLSNFGKYQDAIDSKPRNYLFHSCISPMLNIGLLTPQDVIDIVSKYYNNHKSSITIANYEGFMRQVLGWREYQRYCYLYAYEDIIKSNYFNNQKKLNSKWYTGELGVKPVDDAIKMAFNDGYLHHILRLMVVGNFMNLYGIHPDEVYKWFMEFSLDSYDWVMIQNVYSMAMWCDGGLTMRKPYISGDGYIMKMSNYSKEKNTYKVKDGKNTNEIETYGWNAKWYALFYNFIDKQRNKLKNTYYAGMIKNYDNKTKNEKEEINNICKLISLN